LRHVALNLLHLVPGETGGQEVYARRLAPALLAARPGLRLTLIASREGAPSLRKEPWADAVEVVQLPVAGRSRIRRVLGEQTLLPRELRASGADLLHNPFTTAPALPGKPQVTTIHDLIYRRFPETHHGLLPHGLSLLVQVSARRSTRILTGSFAAKEDIVRWLGVPADRVDVAHHGPGMPSDVTPVAEPELRRALGLGDAPLVLTVSPKRRHKNLARLIAAFGRVEARAVLAIPGYPTDYQDELARLAQEAGAADRVRMLGWVDDPTLEGLYRAATCFVFPSLAEGFGLPVLEAMLRGAPVACSNTTSLPEVAGDAALYFDPEDVEAIAAAVERLLADPGLRERLSAAGRERAGGFNWESAAEATLESYERALHGDRRLPLRCSIARR
jgi:glycosyltransferase involved in cell wall biosynthesis